MEPMPSSASSTGSTAAEDLPVDIEKQHGTNHSGPDGTGGSDQGPRKTASEGHQTQNAHENWQIEPEPAILDTEASGIAGTMNRVLSRISTKSSWNPGAPPDGGKAAWLACFCAHLVVMNTWGFINSFGVFQTYYTNLLGRSPSEVSWIGSIQVFLTFFIGTFAGRITDAGFFRPVLAFGTFFLVLGIFTTSAATSYWQLLLSQGLCMGLGSGCLFTPAISVVSTYFDKKRSLAIGITASGSVSGGLIFPAMARQLLPSIGFGWTVRAIGFVQLATCLFTNFFMRARLPPRRTGSLVEWSAFRELEYTFFAIGMFFNFWGVYFGFYYLSSFARSGLEMNPSLSYPDSLNLLLLVNGVGVIGRLGPNYLADTVGPLNLLIPTCLITGIALLSWMAVGTPAQLYAWSVFYGIAAGGIQSLFPAGLSSLTTDLRKRGTRMGMVFTIVSFAVLTGNPIAGAIIAASGGGYWGAQTFTGCSLLLGMCLIFCARLARQRRDGTGFRVKI
ncbi:aspyridones efflux protein apdF [Apiospora rasikravindrae]|uniref:Aspyridones efflux protein apdF n=1 Tax=Apiospora rasikravindrae TaxID=990691 RepID=A0ABR1TEX1_9PEZI